MGVQDDNLTACDSRGQLLRQLRRLVGEEAHVDVSLRSTDFGELSRVEHNGRSRGMNPHAESECYTSCGVAAIDRLLPGGGLRRGMLVEWVGANDEARMTNDEWKKQSARSSFVIGHSSFSSTLSLLAAREACREGGVLVVIDRERTFYPPAAAAWGIDLERLIVVRPASLRDQLWATVQSLRSPAVAAMWTAIERIDDRAFRRLQLAAQAHQAVGMLVRPASASGQPSWADVRLGVGGNDEWKNSGHSSFVIRHSRPFPSLPFSHSSSARRVQVRVLRCRHGRAGGAAWIEIDDVAHLICELRVDHDTHPLPVVAELADSAGAARSERRA